VAVGCRLGFLTPAEFGAYMAAEPEKWAKLIRVAEQPPDAATRVMAESLIKAALPQCRVAVASGGAVAKAHNKNSIISSSSITLS
jgi:hypothetical protein